MHKLANTYNMYLVKIRWMKEFSKRSTYCFQSCKIVLRQNTYVKTEILKVSSNFINPKPRNLSRTYFHHFVCWCRCKKFSKTKITYKKVWKIRSNKIYIKLFLAHLKLRYNLGISSTNLVTTLLTSEVTINLSTKYQFCKTFHNKI